MKAPDYLAHKPVITVDYSNFDGDAGDARFLSVGRSTWNPEDFSAKIWRWAENGERWSRQSEELPLWRVIDLATLLVGIINHKQSYLTEFVQKDEDLIALQNFISENMQILSPKLEQLQSMFHSANVKLTKQPTPNIFDYATSELSQDAILAWLIQWADPSFSKYDVEIHNLAQNFVRLILCEDSTFEIKSIEVGRQWNNIDIWAEINDDAFLVIEDKTGTTVHDNQLNRYKDIVVEEYRGKRDRFYFSYIKTGNEPISVIKEVEASGYHVVERKQIIDCMEQYKGRNEFIIDFVDHLKRIEEQTMQYQTLPVLQWNYLAWEGFYKELEKKLNINSWGYVANPSGGFLGAWWYFQQITDGEMYLQFEESKLCFKIYYEGEEDKSSVRWKYFDRLTSLTKSKNPEIIKPYRFGAGTYMTIAIVEPKNLFGDEKIDFTSLLQKLQEYQHYIDECCKLE